MRTILLICFVATSLLLGAHSSSALNLSDIQGLTRAKSPKELAKKLDRDEELQKHIILCRYQLRGRKAPTACYPLVAAGKATPAFRFVDQRCKDAIDQEKDLGQVQRALRRLPRHTECAAAAEARQERLLYQMEEEKPWEVFETLSLADSARFLKQPSIDGSKD